MKHRNSHLLVGYWSRLRKGRAVPDQVDVDPRAIKRMLSHVVILDAADPARPLYRLAGSAQCDRYGMELKGTAFLTPWQVPSREVLVGLFRDSLCKGMPICFSSRADTDGYGTLDVETVLAPISFGGELPTRFIGVSQVLGETGSLRGRPIFSERLVWSELVRETELPTRLDDGTPPPPRGGTMSRKTSHLRLVVDRDKPSAVQCDMDAMMQRLIEALEIVPLRASAAR